MKLNDEKVKEMRELRALGVSMEDLAGKYGVSVWTVREAVRGKTWWSVGGPIEQVRKRGANA